MKKLLIVIVLLVMSCSHGAARDYVVKQRFPHDEQAFTQGLVIVDGKLYEGTGLRGQSELRLVDLETGQVIRRRALPESVFGEGITVIGNRVIQISYTSGKGFVYDRDSFELEHRFTYEGQGWGLTHDDHALIMSDGSHVLRFLDLNTYETLRELPVLAGNTPVTHLNELEYINGKLYANIWLTDLIAIINPENGQVLRFIDMKGLWGRIEPDNVLNGIAYDAQQNRLLVTGKRWPWLFEIVLVDE